MTRKLYVLDASDWLAVYNEEGQLLEQGHTVDWPELLCRTGMLNVFLGDYDFAHKMAPSTLDDETMASIQEGWQCLEEKM